MSGKPPSPSTPIDDQFDGPKLDSTPNSDDEYKSFPPSGNASMIVEQEDREGFLKSLDTEALRAKLEQLKNKDSSESESEGEEHSEEEVHSEGARQGEEEVHSEGARQGEDTVRSEGARQGEEEVHSEGARQGEDTVHSEGARQGEDTVQPVGGSAPQGSSWARIALYCAAGSTALSLIAIAIYHHRPSAIKDGLSFCENWINKGFEYLKSFTEDRSR